MRKNILLVDADADSLEAVMQASAERGYAVRLAMKNSQAFGILHRDIGQIDLVLLDLDSDVNGTALLEAIFGCVEHPAVVVLAGAGGGYLKRVAAARGAVCVSKPLTVERLRQAMEKVESDPQTTRACSCDAWGHVRVRNLVRRSQSTSEASLK